MTDYIKKIIIVKEKSSRRKVKGSVKIIKEKSKSKFYVELIASDVNFNDYGWKLTGENKVITGDMQNMLRFDYPLNDDFHFFKGASFCVYNKIDNDILCYGEYGTPLLEENILENNVEYDDEIIASENYYQNEKLLFNQTNFTKNENYEKEQEAKIPFKPFYDEKGFDCFQNEHFSERAKNKLIDLFNSHEKIPALSEVVEGGTFVKINYDNLKSYVVGKIEENKKIKYLLYGVKGRYGEKPKNFYNGAKFIPESEFNLDGAGYYFIFQDGITGEIINWKNSKKHCNYNFFVI